MVCDKWISQFQFKKKAFGLADFFDNVKGPIFKALPVLLKIIYAILTVGTIFGRQRKLLKKSYQCPTFYL
jgi:hypothetical protein